MKLLLLYYFHSEFKKAYLLVTASFLICFFLYHYDCISYLSILKFENVLNFNRPYKYINLKHRGLDPCCFENVR